MARESTDDDRGAPWWWPQSWPIAVIAAVGVITITLVAIAPAPGHALPGDLLGPVWELLYRLTL